MAVKCCDLAYSSLNDRKSFAINTGGVALTRDVRVAWDDGSSASQVIPLLEAIYDALAARGRAEGVFADVASVS